MKKKISKINFKDSLKSELKHIDSGIYKSETDSRYEKYVMYAMPTNNNIVLAVFLSEKKEMFPLDVLAKVSGFIEDKAYEYLVNALNENSNTVAVLGIADDWQTSSYVLYYDQIDTCEKTFEELYSLIWFGHSVSDYTEMKKGEIEGKPLYFD